jgi:nitroimidazol reductase NimA-like FMN-containing flavoprotein (pyridoxamine 5'-phosphate oxidase superfamily)
MRKGVTDNPEVINDILDRAEVLWLAIIDDEGPHSVPINFGMVDGVIYLHSGKKGRKVAAFNSGAPVAFSTVVDIEAKTSDTACSQGYAFRSIMGRGIPRLVTDDKERMVAFDAITLKHVGKLLPYNEKLLTMTAVYAIDIETIKGRIKE